LRCGGTGSPERCASDHRRGDERVASERREVLEGDPVAVSTGRLEDVGGGPGSGDYVVLAMRAGEAALFLDEGPPANSQPKLIDVITGLPRDIVSLTADPSTGFTWAVSSNPTPTSQRSAVLTRLAIAIDPTQPELSFLYVDRSFNLGGVDDGQDVRDLVFHPGGDVDRAFLLSRRPEAIVGIDLDRRGFLPSDAAVWRLFEVGTGPSRMVAARLFGRSYVIATCFDSQNVFIVDVDHGELVSVVTGLSGPFELVADEARGFLYVADFSSSVIRIIDLNPLASFDPAELVGTIGVPRYVEEF
jgi:hypothetical protein